MAKLEVNNHKEEEKIKNTKKGILKEGREKVKEKGREEKK